MLPPSCSKSSSSSNPLRPDWQRRSAAEGGPLSISSPESIFSQLAAAAAAAAAAGAAAAAAVAAAAAGTAAAAAAAAGGAAAAAAAADSCSKRC